MRRAVLLTAAVVAASPFRSAAAQEAGPDAKAGPAKPDVRIGAELVYTYSLELDRESSRETAGALAFNRFGVTVEGSYGRLSFFGRYLWQTFGDFVRVGYIGYRLAPWLELQVGIPVQPFGVRSGLTSGFIYGLAYLLGMEDDADAGATMALTGGPWDVRAGYFQTDELASSSSIRWGADLVQADLDGDSVPDGIGSEANQVNLRLAYLIDHPLGATELGVSGRVGRQVERSTGSTGLHSAAAAHVDSTVGDAHFKGLLAVFDHDTGGGMAGAVVPYAAIGAVYAVAAEGTLVQANVSWGQPATFGPFDRVSLYNDLGAVFKRLEGSQATFIDVAGVGLTGRFVYAYFELLSLRNHPLFDSTLAQGLAAGTVDSWSRVVKTTFGFQF